MGRFFLFIFLISQIASAEITIGGYSVYDSNSPHSVTYLLSRIHKSSGDFSSLAPFNNELLERAYSVIAKSDQDLARNLQNYIQVNRGVSVPAPEVLQGKITAEMVFGLPAEFRKNFLKQNFETVVSDLDENQLTNQVGPLLTQTFTENELDRLIIKRLFNLSTAGVISDQASHVKILLSLYKGDLSFFKDQQICHYLENSNLEDLLIKEPKNLRLDRKESEVYLGLVVDFGSKVDVFKAKTDGPCTEKLAQLIVSLSSQFKPLLAAISPVPVIPQCDLSKVKTKVEKEAAAFAADTIRIFGFGTEETGCKMSMVFKGTGASYVLKTQVSDSQGRTIVNESFENTSLSEVQNRLRKIFIK